MEEDNVFIEDESIVLEDTEDSSTEDYKTSNIIPYIMGRYHRAEDYRQQDEQRWLDAYRNYRGMYGPDVQFTEAEKSRVFIKVTKTKTLAAYQQLESVMFANNKFPLTVDPTELPEGVVSDVHFDPAEPDQIKESDVDKEVSPYGYKGDGKELRAGATAKTLGEMLGPLTDKLKDIDGLKEGIGLTPTAVTFSPAMVAAKKMQKKIQDQLEESNASKHLRNTAFEMALFGTGVMKGPFAIDKEYPQWDEEGNYSPIIKTIPQVSHVSVWNFYPDPDSNNMDEAQYVIERHKMSRSQLRQLKQRPFFRNNVIDEAIDLGENYNKESWEDDLSDYAPEYGVERYEVLEYWGTVDVSMLEEQDVDIPSELSEVDELQANVWICNGKLLRMVINPFKPARIPYHAAPYELNP